MTYEAYLKSSDWDVKRKKTYKKAGYKCQICHTDDVKLNAHHLRYSNLYDVSVGKDLMCLCVKCHMELHEMIQSGDAMSWPTYRDGKRKPTKKQYKKYLKRLGIPIVCKPGESHG